MTLVEHYCTAPSGAIGAFEVLAKIQETEVTFNGDGSSPSMKSITKHPILGPTTTTSVSWVGCARSLSQFVPTLELWGGVVVESWVDAAANTLLPILLSGR